MKYWTQAEDNTLVTSVARFGRSWSKVVQALKRAGGPRRDYKSAFARYAILEAQADRQRSMTMRGSPSTSTSSKRPQQQHTTAALLAASSALHNRPAGQRASPWTKSQRDVLAAIESTGLTPPQVFSAFCRAFPSTVRTQQAVTTKWKRMRKGANGKRKGRGVSCEEETDDDEDGEREEEEGDEEDGEEDPHGQERVATISNRWGSGAAARGAARTPNGSSNSAATHPVRPLQAQRQPSRGSCSVMPAASAETCTAQGLSTPKPTSSRSHLNVTVSYQPNGFHISDLPPGYGVLIHSPTQCQVLSPDQLASYTADYLGHEEDIKLELAPFVFKAGTEGSIEALALPLGSTMSMSLVPVPRDGQRLGTQELKGSSRASTMVETRYEGPDGYLVVFGQCVE